MMLDPKRRPACLALAWCVSVCAGAAHAVEDTDEALLQTIRQVMVEAALSADTRVSASSWLDSHGSLREAQRFTSDVQMRDLTVRSVSRPTDSTRCEALQSHTPLMQVMRVGMDLSPALSLEQRYLAQLVGRDARARLLTTIALAKHWRVMSDVAYAQAYDRLQYGHGEEYVQWRLQLTVLPTFSSRSHDVSPLTLQWQVQIPGQATPWFVLRQEVVPARATVDGVTPTIDQDMAQSIEQAVNGLVERLDQRLACDPQPFAVQTAEGERWTINAGQTAGLKVGDRVLLADARVLPAHALEQGSLDAAVLAEVQSVTPYRAQLRPLTPIRSQPTTDWVAWPYTY